MKYLPSLPNWLLISGASFTAVIFLMVLAISFLTSGYQKQIYPGVRVAGINVGGLTTSEAYQKIAQKISSFDPGLPVTFEGKTIYIGGQTLASNPEIVNQMVIFDPGKTVEYAFRFGRSGDFFTDIYDQLMARFRSQDIPLAVFVDRLRITEELKNNFSDLEKPVKNAQLVFSNSNDFQVVIGQDGVGFNSEVVIDDIITHFENGDNSSIVVKSNIIHPEVVSVTIDEIRDQVDRFLSLPTLTLTSEKQNWTITPAIIQSWLELKKVESATTVVFSETAIKNYLTEKIAPELEVESQPPRLEINNGRATVWQSGQDGVTIDSDATIKAITAWSITPSGQPDNKVAIVTKITVNSEVDQGADDLGLKEIIGTGISNFSGSPKNRRHNIKTGAMALHGLLIKPGEEFSLLKALGEIDATSGYLPELVIKENKTTPEYGGGLCQIGTTMFRATFNSGLPVTQRRNHSYRVVYYEPAGTDATIYDPAPDFRFINDTGHYILIQARLGENDLAFDFWGTKDGRVAEASKPVIYNIVQPPPTKTIETTDLAPGEKKCTEKAHAGADAYFDYKVTYVSGEVKEKRFSSHYVPWQAVCLLGVKEISPTPSEPSLPTGVVTPLITPDATR